MTSITTMTTQKKENPKKNISCIFQIMYLKLTLVPLIKKKFKFGIFLFVNSFLISVPLKKKVLFKCLFLFYFYNKNPK